MLLIFRNKIQVSSTITDGIVQSYCVYGVGNMTVSSPICFSRVYRSQPSLEILYTVSACIQNVHRFGLFLGDVLSSESLFDKRFLEALARFVSFHLNEAKYYY